MAKLTKAQRVTLQLSADFGTIRVFSDQRREVSDLAAKGFVEHGGTLLDPTATITDAGRAALSEKEAEQ